MIWYLFNILILTAFYVFWPKEVVTLGGNVINAEASKKKWICIIGCGCWILLSGLRHTSVGADTEAYGSWFDRILNTPWKELWNDVYNAYFLGEEIKDPGYNLFVKFIQIFTENYTVFLIIVAVLFFVPFGVYLYRYAQTPYLSFVLFSTLFYSFFAITGIRQTIATALVVFIGMKYIQEKKLFKFLLLAIVASMIHKSALCFIPFYFMSRIKIKRLTLFYYWVAFIIAFIFRYQLLSFLQQIVGYEYYTDDERAAAGMFLYLLLFVAVLVSLYHKRILSSSNSWITIPAINALMIACFFSPLLLINPNMMRVVQYYSIFLVIILGEGENLFRGHDDKVAYRIVCTAFLLYTFMQKRPEYMFFWQ